MTPEQIQLVRTSFALVAPIAPTAAAIFYDELFRADPSLKRLFKSDMQEQGAQLMQMIGAAVGLLGRPQSLLPVLRQLGKRHVAYGVLDGHYATVGGALLKTLEMGLGSAFDAPTRQAWTVMYGVVSSTMMAAAHEDIAVPELVA